MSQALVDQRKEVQVRQGLGLVCVWGGSFEVVVVGGAVTVRGRQCVLSISM
jgi:hypothetical protein